MRVMFTGDPKFLPVAASGDTTLVAAVAGRRIALLGAALSAGAAGATLKFQSDPSAVTTTSSTTSTTGTTPAPATDLTGARTVGANGEVNYNLQGIPHFVTNIGEALNLILSAGEINGSLVYQVIR